jgi:hypothetical protein
MICHMCRRVSDSSESEQWWVKKQVCHSYLVLPALWCHDYCPECLKILSGSRKGSDASSIYWKAPDASSGYRKAA